MIHSNKQRGSALVIVLTLVILVVIAVVTIGIIGSAIFQGNSGLSSTLKNLTGGSKVEWKEVVSSEGHFKVLLPSEPQKSVETKKAGNSSLEYQQTMYTSIVSSDEAYIVGFDVFPDAVDLSKNSKEFLKAIAEGFAGKDSDNRVLSSANITYKGYEAVEMLLKNEKENAYVKMRVILVKNRLYILNVASIDKEVKEYERFVNSFELL